jgi:hypothetical protein
MISSVSLEEAHEDQRSIQCSRKKEGKCEIVDFLGSQTLHDTLMYTPIL